MEIESVDSYKKMIEGSPVNEILPLALLRAIERYENPNKDGQKLVNDKLQELKQGG